MQNTGNPGDDSKPKVKTERGCTGRRPPQRSTRAETSKNKEVRKAAKTAKIWETAPRATANPIDGAERT